jgi:hypothetical protein
MTRGVETGEQRLLNASEFGNDASDAWGKLVQEVDTAWNYRDFKKCRLQQVSER